ncbi:MAG TPA: acetyltransferase [Gammaproteobacteria bacterium]
MTDEKQKQLKEQTRAACLKAARDAYSDAQMRGLCAEGALEAALGAIEMLDLDALAEQKTRQ